MAENLPPEQIKVQEECQMAQGRAVYHHEVDNEESGRIEISYHVENHTCLCGDSEVPVAEVKDYICDMNIHWRCNREDGCACGDVRCKRSQICLAPGVCSQ